MWFLNIWFLVQQINVQSHVFMIQDRDKKEILKKMKQEADKEVERLKKKLETCVKEVDNKIKEVCIFYFPQQMFFQLLTCLFSVQVTDRTESDEEQF